METTTVTTLSFLLYTYADLLKGVKKEFLSTTKFLTYFFHYFSAVYDKLTLEKNLAKVHLEKINKLKLIS